MTDYRLEYHPAAKLDIFAAAQWYKERSDVAAARFALELEARMQIIRAAPERWPVFEEESRRTLLKRFPFAIVYRVRGDVVEVAALMHHRREPHYWKNR